MKRLFGVLIGLAVVAMISTPVYALSLQQGFNQFKFTGFSYVVDADSSGTFSVDDQLWGVGELTSAINSTSGAYNPIGTTEEANYIFWGPTIKSVTGITSLNVLWDGTAYLNIYGDTDGVADFNAAGGPLTAGANGTAGVYPGVSDLGELYLSAEFVPGGNVLAAYGADVVMLSDINLITKKGTNLGYLDVTGGTYAGDFQQGFYGGLADLEMFSNLTLLSQAPGGGTWTTQDQDPLSGNVIPEPASMSLFGAGIAALLGFYRRFKL